MGTSLAMDDFLGHETQSRTGQFFRGWRKRQPPQADVFLHRSSAIVALWQHGLPRVYEKEEKDGSKSMKVSGSSFNCLESEEVLKKQYKRDRETGERVIPPVVCPVCRLMENLRELYAEGEIGFCEQLFKWEGDDPQETQVLTYGGMCNLYGSKYLSDEEESEKVSNRIRESESWKENIYAKCNYVFAVVDASEPDKGVQIAIETTSLGDHVKTCIRDRMVSEGADKGNPVVTPYALRWEHHPNAVQFDKKYKCIAMPRIQLTSTVEELINGDAPDLGGVTRPGNITALRADLEAHYIGPVELDWDDIFGPAERAGFGEKQEDNVTKADEEDDEQEEAPPQRTTKKAAAKKKTTKKAAKKEEPKKEEPKKEPAKARRRKKAEPEPEPPESEEEEEDQEDDEEKVACEECGFMMAADASVCEQCGAEYDLEGDEEDEDEEEEPPPPPPKKKERGKKKVTF